MSELEDIMGGEKANDLPSSLAAPPTAEGGTNNDAIVDPTDDGIEIASLEVAGVIRDEYGNTWQVPGDNVEDLDDLYAGDIYKIPAAMEEKFHVQMIAISELKAYALRHFVPVLQEELGIPKELIKDMGSPLDKYHCVGDAIMVKIPRVIHDRIKELEVRETKERLIQMNPTQAMLKKGSRDGIIMSYEHKTSVNLADPNNRQGIFADEQGRVK